MAAAAIHTSEKQYSPARSLGNTEQNWCRAVASGTGITVLALQMAIPPPQIAASLTGILEKLQTRHPLLAAKLHYNRATKSFSFLQAPAPAAPHAVALHDAPTTAKILAAAAANSPLHAILEHELNTNSWSHPGSFPCSGAEILHVAVYAATGTGSVVALRFHTSVCDRATAVSVLRELMEMVGGAGPNAGIGNEGEGKMGIESLIPVGTAKKTLWAHGLDTLGYSVNSLRLTNLTFQNTKMPRRSEVVRLQIATKHTALILERCKSKGIKICGVLAAAAIIAANSTKHHTSDTKKYGVVTLTDCRAILQPPLSHRHYGFYHSAILNIHKVKGSENVWDLAKTCYMDFADYKKSNKHFSDMADLNFLMSKAIDNPALTASSSLRTSLVTVFEDPVLDDSLEMQRSIGAEDFVGCASVHGVGPSIAIFDTVREGRLDCTCVYPAPLHSREQMSELVERISKVLIDGVTEDGTEV
ncbi:uncharacterized protein LOC125209071 [Salvia hispanica]|uniref:uncharacterized protein LOC125209071 n=1 Tax=Salvia hispanica TaxID=49212 RepID=UPI0020092151|nr:uncharacterized protein LOC125209071 [Salvia hispanica]